MEKFDVVIAGCGPSGTAAASVLASAGMQVALMDKGIFPRDKLCGGLLSDRARVVFEGIFREPLKSVVEHEAGKAGFYHSGRLLTEVESPCPFYLTSRRSFDSHLLELAQARGARVFEASPVTSIDRERCEVSSRSGRVFKADFIIGADGVTSRVRKALFPETFHKDGYALCFQADVDRGEMPEAGSAVQIHFGFVRWGYGWIFPKKDTYSVGVGALASRNPGMKHLFRQFHAYAVGKYPESVKGHYIPYGNYLKCPGNRNILLTGDAAGLVEPITGEGISWAMLSGKYAAEGILQAAQAGTPARALELYRKKYRTITGFFSPAKVMRSFIFSGLSEPYCMKALPHSSSILQDYLQVIAGRMNYREFVHASLEGWMRKIFRKASGA